MSTAYTGMDAVIPAAKFVGGAIGAVARTVASLPQRYVSTVVKANKAQDVALKAKQQKDIERAFGSVDNYNRVQGLMPK